jgi:hypothetical protein
MDALNQLGFSGNMFGTYRCSTDYKDIYTGIDNRLM